MPVALTRLLEIRDGVLEQYADVLTPQVRAALDALVPFDGRRRELMRARIARRLARAREHQRITFLAPDAVIGGTTIRVSDARAGRFDGGEVTRDLQRQWIQGTGPGAKPNTPLARSIRNVAYALLSGADG